MIRALKFTQKGDLMLMKLLNSAILLNLKALRFAKRGVYAEFKSK